MNSTNSTAPETSEEWRPIPSTRGLYEASSLGRIRYVGPPRPGVRVGGIKALSRNRDGYLYTGLTMPGEKSRLRAVHRLVCEAFHGEAPDWSEVTEHRDDDKSNNRPANLFWSTHKANMNRPGCVAKNVVSTAAWHDRMTAEERAERGRKISEARSVEWARKTPEERSALARKAWADKTPEERSEGGRTAWSKQPPQQRAEMASKVSKANRAIWAEKTPEERAEHGRRISEAMRSKRRAA